MSIVVLSDETPVARKTHTCSCCNGTIGVGDTYCRQRIIGDDPYTHKAHQICHQLVLWAFKHNDWWDDGEGLWVEPYAMRELVEGWFTLLIGKPFDADEVNW